VSAVARRAEAEDAEDAETHFCVTFEMISKRLSYKPADVRFGAFGVFGGEYSYRL
jgi:hypothetical protein